MTNPTAEIRQVLYARLIQSLPIGTITADDVAWPNAEFSPDVTRMYLAAFCLFGETNTASLSETGFEKQSGVFQVTIFGVLNSGEFDLDSVALELLQNFRSGVVLEMTQGRLTFQKTYRSSIIIGRREGLLAQTDSRPQVVVSAHWQHYYAKGV